MANLLDLPGEVLQEIHLLALNPFLALVHPRLRSALDSGSPYYSALYLLRLYGHLKPEDILTRAVRHRICSVNTVRMIERLWPLRCQHRGISGSGARNEATPAQSVPELSCSELPRRLFRSLGADEKIDPLLRYLVERFTPSANSHKGYPLCRAVLAQNLEYIDFLLAHGASPSANDGLAIEIAISKQRLDIVKRLVERSSPKATNNKKIKYDDRVKVSTRLVEHAMKSGSRDIVDYFVHDKGVMPPLRIIMKMGKGKGGLRRSEFVHTK